MLNATLAYTKEVLEFLLGILYYTEDLPDEVIEEAEQALVSIDRVISWLGVEDKTVKWEDYR